MLKLIVGVKGSGKTKTLIDMVNTAADQTNGCVVCVEKGTNLRHTVKHQVRLVDTDEYLIKGPQALFGAVSGMYASNHDITHIFIDHTMKICRLDIAAFEEFALLAKELCDLTGVEITATVNIALEELPASLKAYVI